VTDHNLFVKNPLQYLDGEVNASHKDFEGAKARIALVFPDLYELGMSHLGLKILYEILNAREEFLAERAFAPWTDRNEQLRRLGVPLCSLESGRPLGNFDLVGFTLPYELTYTNILNILDLAGIPLAARDRTGSHPFVGGGGPGAANPEVLAEFFDFFLVGDGEEAILEIAAVLAAGRGRGREGTLRKLAGIEGVYVPSLYRAVTGEGGEGILSLEPLHPGVPAVIRKRVLLDLDSAPYPVRPPVPYLETTHDRVTIEIARGCIQRCRFCQASTTYRPYRERSLRTVLEMADRGLASTGYDEISLAALSCGDYRRLEPLLAELMARYADEKVSISLPSLRPGTITGGILREVKKVRRTGFTIAPEAGSQRLRDVVSKGVTEEQIMETCSRLFREGWNRVKLYFMIGLPTETADDRDAIIDLAVRIRKAGKEILGRFPHLSVSVSSFVPKPHTPFQWSSQLTPSELHPILGGLRARLKKRGITFKWHQPELSALEGAISRGDRRMAGVIRSAWEKGRTFDGWTENFDFQPWAEAFREHGIDLDAFIGRERRPEEPLPWDHFTSADLKEFLFEERNRALEAIPSPACDPTDCPSCGLCEDYPMPGGENEAIEAPAEASPGPATVNGKVRLEFTKYDRMKYLPHLSLMRTFHRALRRAKVPLAYSQGHTPHPKIQPGPPLPMGYEGDCEYIDIETSAVFSPAEISRRLNASLPEGIEIRRAVAVHARSRSLFDMINLQTYRVILPKKHLPSEGPGEWLLSRLRADDDLNIEKTRRGKVKTVNLRPSIATAELSGESGTEIEILLSLHRVNGSAPRPGDVIRVAGGFNREEEFGWKITRTANLVLEDERWNKPINLSNNRNRARTATCRR
jgi:radical SAM family uncharacterized protein/radical SAM-linked protein